MVSGYATGPAARYGLNWYTQAQHYNMRRFTLESYRIFPYIAWTTFILFALFVYMITLDLKQAINDLQTTTANLESRIETEANGQPSTTTPR